MDCPQYTGPQTWNCNLQNFSRLLTKERFSIKEFRYSYKYKNLYAFSQSWARNDVLRSLSGKHLVHLLKLSPLTSLVPDVVTS